ncbi:unnamed protein product [Linum trigynum]|uniref:Uncharacterized protein n=1 Tax=Linum trigynum TaxID=586398 RepID=A0AAV2DK04_9ROSI
MAVAKKGLSGDGDSRKNCPAIPLLLVPPLAVHLDRGGVDSFSGSVNGKENHPAIPSLFSFLLLQSASIDSSHSSRSFSNGSGDGGETCILIYYLVILREMGW